MSRKAGSKEMIRPPRTVKQEANIKGIIFPAVEGPVARSELHRRLDATVRSWLTAACTWKDRHAPGSFRYLVFAFEPQRGVKVYVQFWSEPLEPVCWQVSSGHPHPPTRSWLGPQRAERIRVFGFEIGGDAENFEQFVVFNSARDVARAAHLVVDILASALDYRAQQPLTVELGAGVHGPTPQVHDSFTPTQVIEVMTERGHSLVGIENDDTSAMLRFRRRGIYTTVELGDRCEGTRSFRTMGLTCELEPSAEDVARLSAATRDHIPPGATPVVRLGDTLRFSGGVTRLWFVQRVAEWDRMTTAYRREQRMGARVPRPMATATPSQVH